MIAAIALGRPIPKGAEVHHVDGDHANNAPGNLVICQDHAYHMLLHRRQRILAVCGSANGVLCRDCRKYGDPKVMVRGTDPTEVYHPECKARLDEEERLEREQWLKEEREEEEWNRREDAIAEVTDLIPAVSDKVALEISAAAKTRGLSVEDFFVAAALQVAKAERRNGA
jgi:hypothetical protein